VPNKSKCALALLPIWLYACGGGGQHPEAPQASATNPEVSSLSELGCSIELPGRWEVDKTSEPTEGDAALRWEARSDDNKSQLAVSVVEPDPSKPPDRDAVDAVLGLRQDAEKMESGEGVTFSPRHFDEDPIAPGGFYSSQLDGADPMLTIVRWAPGRTCVFNVTGALVDNGATHELGVELLAKATATARK
jgi:hypothetical protein